MDKQADPPGVELPELTPKQELFVAEYLQRFNATEAAIAAGYSKRSARSIGSENLSKPAIATRIRARLDEAGASADEVLRRLTDHLRGTMADFVKVDAKGNVAPDLRRARVLHKLHLVESFTFERETRTFGSGDEATTVVTESIRLGLYSAQAAAQLLGKHHRLFDRALEGDWQREMEKAGLDPADEFDQLVRRYAATLRADETGDGGDAGGGVGGSTAAG